MKILLDTHYLIWLLVDTKKVSKKIKAIILRDRNDIFVSPVSLWEISLKYSRSKLELKNITPDDFLPAIKKSGFLMLPFNGEQAASFYKLPRLKNKDPFDRMIIWQSIQNDCHLLSADGAIRDECGELNLKIVV